MRRNYSFLRSFVRARDPLRVVIAHFGERFLHARTNQRNERTKVPQVRNEESVKKDESIRCSQKEIRSKGRKCIKFDLLSATFYYFFTIFCKDFLFYPLID